MATKKKAPPKRGRNTVQEAPSRRRARPILEPLGEWERQRPPIVQPVPRVKPVQTVPGEKASITAIKAQPWPSRKCLERWLLHVITEANEEQNLSIPAGELIAGMFKKQSVFRMWWLKEKEKANA